MTLENAETVFVDGWWRSDPPAESYAGGVMLYSLTLTADQAADASAAIAAGCPVNVNFWTRGQMLRQWDAESGFSATIKTNLVNAIEDLLLGTIDIAMDAPPSPNGNYQVEHDVEVGVPLAVGDTLTVEATASAYARALGDSTGDYASAYFRMYRERTSGAPMLEMCVP